MLTKAINVNNKLLTCDKNKITLDSERYSFSIFIYWLVNIGAVSDYLNFTILKLCKNNGLHFSLLL